MNSAKLLIILFILPACVFAEDVSGAFGGEKPPPPFDAAESLPIVVRQNSMMFFPFNYQFLDGTPLIFRDKLRQILGAVPENKKLLRQEKGWRTMAYIFGALCMASTAAHSAYLFSDYPNRDAIMLVAYFGEVAGFGLTFWAGMTANNKIARAVDNYNLSIMGIPIR
ncbi:MAG: hypothetical protein LBG43_04680 [Treponema sp.]|jgi:hypothetical protein|nr:hypothetical protein [Treponema sp.]